MKTLLGVLAITLIAPPVFAQAGTQPTSAASWNGLPDRFQIDTGYFRLQADSVLRFKGADVDFEKDLGVDSNVDTFWLDGTWRVGRRHQLKLAFTRIRRDRKSYSLQRDFVWGGETYSAGLEATTTTGTDLLGGYYRFAVVRNDRFEIGPALGVGYLWLDATIAATGTVNTAGGAESRSIDRSASTGEITGAIGGYAAAWPAKRLQLQADYLYIRVKPGDSEAAVTDWRVAAYLYFTHHVGVGGQYKFYRYSYDRSIESAQLGGELTFQGGQVFLSLRF